MSYNSKYSGAQVEDLLDQVASGNVGGGGITSETDPVFLASPAAKITEQQISDWESKPDSSEIPTKTSQLTNDSGFITAEESPKIYHMDGLVSESGTVSQEVYDAILAADVVVYDSTVADVYIGGNGTCEMQIIGMLGSFMLRSIITIAADLSYTITTNNYRIPKTTSQLTNDSGFITAADLPPSGGLPTEVIELSSEVTLQEGKMLEINMTTPVTEALALREPTITDATQGLLFGIRFNCGASVPQLTLDDALGFASRWVNGEPPLLEAYGMVEIIGVRMTSVGVHLLAWAIYKL